MEENFAVNQSGRRQVEKDAVALDADPSSVGESAGQRRRLGVLLGVVADVADLGGLGPALPAGRVPRHAGSIGDAEMPSGVVNNARRYFGRVGQEDPQ